MPDRLDCNPVSIPAVRHRLGRSHAVAVQPMLPALFRGVVFIALLAAPFVAALLAR
jgi:hypothetical protein